MSSTRRVLTAWASFLVMFGAGMLWFRFVPPLPGRLLDVLVASVVLLGVAAAAHAALAHSYRSRADQTVAAPAAELIGASD